MLFQKYCLLVEVYVIGVAFTISALAQPAHRYHIQIESIQLIFFESSDERVKTDVCQEIHPVNDKAQLRFHLRLITDHIRSVREGSGFTRVFDFVHWGNVGSWAIWSDLPWSTLVVYILKCLTLEWHRQGNTKVLIEGMLGFKLMENNGDPIMLWNSEDCKLGGRHIISHSCLVMKMDFWGSNWNYRNIFFFNLGYCGANDKMSGQTERWKWHFSSVSLQSPWLLLKTCVKTMYVKYFLFRLAHNK